ncbi:O-antigen ligase family protein [Candidatus Hepatobacter penaei]|uniref:O-antigen ligase family protein n=1 Tax=Candidatus Hepatobacter penaei TaxID=1274402 RepID=UPI001FE1ABD6|nr:O-antigen ligase family protein [Candidatus Hepatobacter penaei]
MPADCWPLKIATYLAVLVPLSFPFSKVVADIALSLVGCLFLFNSFWRCDWQWCRHSLVRFLGVINVYMVVSALCALQPSWPLVMSALAYGRFFLLFAAVVFWIGRQPSCVRAVMTASALSLVCVACDSLFQYITDFSVSGRPRFERRLTSFFRRPYVGFFINTLLFPVGLFFLRALHRSSTKWALFPCMGVCVICVFLTGDRAPSALLALSLLSVAGMYAYHYPTWRWPIFFGGLFTMLAGYSFAMTQYLLSGRFFVLLRELSVFSTTSYGQLFKSSFLMVREHPVMGVGYKMFSVPSHALYEQGLVTYAGLHAHNYYLGWLAELGALGLVSFFALVGFFVRAVYVSDVHGRVLGTGALLVMFWPLTTTMDFFSSATSVINWYALALLMVAASTHKGRRIHPVR